MKSRQGKTLQELQDMDKKQKRKAWWADRLGGASAILIGGSTGYGIGSAIQNMFGWNGISGPKPPVNPTTPPPNTGPTTTPPNTGTPTGTTPTNIGTPTGGEGLGNAEWFRASDYGWDPNRLGWLGDRVSVGPQGGSHGLLQKDFFGELTKLVPKEKLMGQASGDVVNSFLRNAYNGVNPTQAAQSAAQALGY